MGHLHGNRILAPRQLQSQVILDFKGTVGQQIAGPH